jgi:hypothetical protein
MRLQELTSIQGFEVRVQINNGQTSIHSIFARSIDDAIMRAHRKYGEHTALVVRPFPDIFETSAVQSKTPAQRQADAYNDQADKLRKKAKATKARERVAKAQEQLRKAQEPPSASQR